jgi:threonine synthase
MSFPEIALAVARLLLKGEIPDTDLEKIVRESMSFPVTLHPLRRGVNVLELFHGPTLAFKDFGARFMARALAFFQRGENGQTTVLVATSGDTGSAVGQGFAGVEGFRVVILYPAGRVSPIQEQQLTTIGGNVTALEVDGTFDDCQRLAKVAFADPGLSARLRLTSANSINIARLVPQSFYYFEAVARADSDERPVVIAVPCGNLGNLTAGLIAWKMGLPVRRFVAAANANRVFVDYVEGGSFAPRQAVPTLSNAMDVGNPSNIARIMALFPHGVETLREVLVSDSISDVQTKENIAHVHAHYGYILDPHAAVAYGALERHGADNCGIVLGTAHPAKFLEAYDPALRDSIEVPAPLREAQRLEKQSIRLPNRQEALNSFLLDH